MFRIICKKILNAITPALLVALSVQILAETTSKNESGYSILQAVEQQSRLHKNQHYDIFMEIRDDKNRERTRHFSSWNKYKPNKSLGLVRFYRPASINGTSLLSSSVNDENTTHQWIYLPAFRSVKKLSNEDKHNSFMGSDFSNADIGGRNLNSDVHEIVSEDENYYIVESTPKSKNDPYGKLKYRVQKNVMVVKRVDFYDRDNNLLKILNNKKIRKHKGMYIVVSSTMKNPNTGGKTTLTVNKISTDIVKKDNFYSTRGLRQ